MPHLARLSLRAYLAWSLGLFASKLALALALSQRVLLIVVLLSAAIGLSALLSHTLIVASAQELALKTPTATPLSSPTTAVFPTPLQQPEAKILWEYYKRELQEHAYNRSLLSNIILLAGAQGLEKDVAVYQRRLYLADPLLACTFSSESDGLLNITCPTPLF